MSLIVITRNKYLVYSEEFFGGDKSSLFDDKDLAMKFAREWVKEKDHKVAIFVATFVPDANGTYTRLHAEEPEAEELTKQDLI